MYHLANNILNKRFWSRKNAWNWSSFVIYSLEWKCYIYQNEVFYDLKVYDQM